MSIISVMSMWVDDKVVDWQPLRSDAWLATSRWGKQEVAKQLYFDTSLAKIATRLLGLLIKNRSVVVLCIGSDRLVGDSLGPLCGQYLKYHFDTPCFVYGCLANPINALNLADTLQYINIRHKKSLVIAIDSMIGHMDTVGKCKLIYGGISPGSADGKRLPMCGDLSLTAIIADCKMPPYLNHNIRLGNINHLAYTLASIVNGAVQSQMVATIKNG